LSGARRNGKETSKAASDSSYAPGGETSYPYIILLAEDNAINQTLAVRLLEKRGYSVTVTPDGQAAVEAFQTGGFELVLMDIQMPVMDGFQATAAIREREKLTGGLIPIIAMTAHALVGDQERCLASGMDGNVSKPIRTSELFAAIERMLGEKLKPEHSGWAVGKPPVGASFASKALTWTDWRTTVSAETFPP
jgi:CheY-like chemotaxis protein